MTPSLGDSAKPPAGHSIAAFADLPLAHGVGESADLPLPLDLVLQAGAATLVLSFLIAGLWWREPRLRPSTPHTLGIGHFLRYPVLLLALYVTGYAVAGPRGPENPAPHALFVLLWVGLVPVSMIAGPVWRTVNPLRTLFTLLGLPRRGLRPLPPGASASVWPAAAFLLAFVWFELVVPHHGDPVAVGLFLLAYAVSQLLLATLRGEEWFARGDSFEVYSDLAGRLSPFRWRPLLSGLAGPVTNEPTSAAPAIPAPTSPQPPAEAPSPALAAAPSPAQAEAPSSALAEAPSSALAEAPSSALAEAPSSAQAEAPSSAQAEAPSSAQAEAPSPAQAEAPSSAQAEAPSSAQAEAPSSALAEAPSSALAEAPSPAQAEAPSPAQAEAPSPAQAEAPSSALAEAPSSALAEAPSPALAEAPSPAQAAAPSPAQAGVPSPAQAAAPSPAQAGVPSPAQAGVAVWTRARRSLASAGLAAFIAVWWGSTVFDSASSSPAWTTLTRHLGSPLFSGTAGLVLLCSSVFLAVRWTAGRLDVTMSLIPIAAGYTLAHYLSLLITEGPRGLLLLVGSGTTATITPSPQLISSVQIALILIGHAVGVIVAHDRALAEHPGRPLLAVLADEFPMVLFMIGCTWAGLFLLFVR